MSARLVLFGVVVASLTALLTLALTREFETANQPPARPVVAAPRPPLSAAEEAYAQALWPIHNEVKANALKMTMAGLQYKTRDIDVVEFRARILGAVDAYRGAERQVGSLQPPPSFQGLHDEYLEAVRRYEQAALEMVRVYDDRQDEHLLIAFPWSQESGRALLRVGSALWPTEYVPQ